MQDITEPALTVERVGGDRQKPRKKLLVMPSQDGTDPEPSLFGPPEKKALKTFLRA